MSFRAKEFRFFVDLVKFFNSTVSKQCFSGVLKTKTPKTPKTRKIPNDPKT